MKKLISLVLVLSMLLSALSIGVMAEELPELDENETEIIFPEGTDKYVASVNLNATGDGFEVGKYELLTEETDLVGLYYLAKNANGKDKVLQYARGEAEPRKNWVHTETVSVASGEYKMVRLKNSESFIQGTWTGAGLTNAVKAYGYGQAVAEERWLVPYAAISPELAEKLYLYTNDKETTLATYATNFGTDSEVYALVEGYYGDLDADGMAAEAAKILQTARETFEGNVISYALTPEEVIPVNELESIQFTAYKHQGAFGISGKVYGKAVFYIALPTGEIVERTWTSEAKTYSSYFTYTVDVQSTPELPTEGWIVGVEIAPLGKIDDDATITVGPRKLTEATQNLRFSNTQFMPILYPETNVIKSQTATPELKYDYAGDGNFTITIINAEAGVTYAYKTFDGEWTTLSAGESSFTVSEIGYYYVKAVGTDNTVDSVISRINVESKQGVPELTLGAGYTLTAPDDANYEIAKLVHATEPVYETFTTKTLTAGVWAVRKAERDGIISASDPQYFYIEGEDAGSIVFGTTTGTALTEGRWTGTLGTAYLYDANSTKWTSTDKLYVYASIGTAHFDENDTYSAYGYRYKFRESEIIPVSVLNDVTVSKTTVNPTFSYTSEETSVTITKSRTFARVYVVGADVEYYDVYDDNGNVKAGYMSFNFPLSQLADKEGYVTAIEFYPIYRFLDDDGNVIESPQIAADRSWSLGFTPLEMDENVTISDKTGIDSNGNHKFSLVLADKAETPTLSVERAGDKFKINITNAVDGYTYQYKSETVGWTILEKGADSFIVDSVGTYYVKTVTDGTLLSSDAVTISFEGIKDTPNLVLGEGNVITAPEDEETYQYAKLGYNVEPEYADFTTAVLTAGVWAVRVKGDEKILDSNPQIIYVMGEDAGSVRFATSTSLEMTKGVWTGTLGSANLFDWDNYSKEEALRFTDEHIEIYYGISNDYFTNNTYNNYGYRYILEDSEIVGLDDLVDLNAKVKNGTTIKCGSSTVHYSRTRARVHVVGGDADYYDVYTVSNFNNSSNGFDFNLSQLNDKAGYVVAIELYLFDALTDSDGNELEGSFTSGNVSYGITFSDLILHEDVTLASQANNNTGLSADGDNRYSLTIANDPRAPKYERLESNPNGLIIKNYIEGAKYAWASSLDGEWTEIEGNSVVFAGYGSYYLKLIGDENYPELINYKPFTTSDVVLTGASLVLDGAIGVKVYFDVANDAVATASYSVIDANTKEEVYGEENVAIKANAEGRKYIIIPVYPKDADNLEVKVTVDNLTDGFSHSATTGVRTYINLLKLMANQGNQDCIDALAVIESMETYIAYAHNYFYKSTTDELPDDVTVDLDAINATPDHVIVDDGTLKCASLVGATLLLEGETSIRYYFQVTDANAFAAYRGYCNEKELPVIEKSNGIYYFEIADIAAHNINRAYTLELYDGNNNLAVKVTFRATNYIKGQINSTQERLPNLMKALYNYYVESAAYYEISRNSGQRAEILAAMERAKATTLDELNVRYYPDYQVQEEDEKYEDYGHIQAITYDGLDYKGQKTKVFAYVGFPEGASAENPVPAIVLVHGGGGHPFMDWVKIWNDRGYAAIAMETTGNFPTSTEVTYNEGNNVHFAYDFGAFAEDGYILAPNRVPQYPTTYTPIDEHWAYHGLTQPILASNILRADERWDGENIGITGVSWGGTMVSQIIGYDDRYTFAIPVYGTAYLSTDGYTFSKFDDPYVNSLWAAERNLDNVDIPTFWFTYNDDNNFCVPAYCKSYLHTAALNEKNSLLMLDKWSHSHGSVFNKKHPFWFADWVTYGTGGFVTFADQPKGAKVNCNLNIPEGIEGDITATVYYIDKPMAYEKWEKYEGKNYMYLTSYWQSDSTCLTVDKETGVVSGTVPEAAAGYYININYTLEDTKCESSSIYVALK